ncbi:CcoQ/FixQ family Cbb3-type cytochrome c oxidase assembly chaperone [Phyllobacterium brassicacearum]|uniref:CcoQ/FixQ family Cbb3-type cytochrome c oxidase assembly chaperone n=1 Tax=Phyllobacterium brassicacearum TaxID=314235 RepID=A0A2P7B6A1_9HYPH|nr:cbb3-type cytochrome c oxidase subunit 3 [Phyllobacterium brassicacearum]PSH61983.1 CcoQ/FixQ family Cbb3-type cytochrome c oxidase assembly chaperone [Phyllobacterium brassicacearum]TDQ14884.1 cytochrome c oxidase cbb3-type subunit 4 [Phyllobacterium brassicacearum]
MTIDHEMLTGFSKSFGLFYLIAMSIGVLVYAYWPSNKEQFAQAAAAVVSDEEDRPCQ